MKNTQEKRNEVSLFIYGAIGEEGGLSASSFVETLNAAEISDAEEIRLYINSPGGKVDEGLTIYHALKHCQKPVVAVVEGLAASMASLVALGAGRLEMSPYALLMLHYPMTAHGGNAQELRESAEKLDKLGESLVQLYAQELGRSEMEVSEWMAKETWFTATECLEMGIAQGVLKGKESQEPEGENKHAMAGVMCEVYGKLQAAEAKSAQTKSKLLNALQAELQEARAQLEVKEREHTEVCKYLADKLLEESMKAGKIHPKTRGVWDGLFARDFAEAKALLESLGLPPEGVMAKLRKGGNGQKKNRSIRDWEKEDPMGLLEMRRHQPEEYQRLFEEFYG